MADKRRQAAIHVVESLEEAGFEAYLVGGCVRDYVLKRRPQDYDVATNASPEQVQAIFRRTIATGIKYGTVTVVHDRIPIEVTTFRIESDYQDHRRPAHVKFVSSLKQDLARRDFTFNAMAQDHKGRIYDYFSGMDDLRAKRVRTVGDPEERFREDPLRIVRAARFAAQFDFRLEGRTERAMSQCKHQCVHLSVERVTAEIEKIWKAHRSSLGVGILFACGVMQTLPPFCFWEIRGTPAQDELLPLDWTDDRIIRWAYLLDCCGVTVEEVKTRLRQLRLSNMDVTAISTCYRLGTEWMPLTESMGKRLLLREGLPAVNRGSLLAKFLKKIPHNVPIDEQLRTWWSEMPIKQVRELAVNGKELIEHCGCPAGPWVQKTLMYLLEQVALAQMPNEKNILLKEGCRFGATDSQ